MDADIDDVEDWDEEFGFSEDLDSVSGTDGEDDSQRSNGANGEPKNRIVGITADRFVATEDNEWDDDFDFDDTVANKAAGDSFESIRKSAMVSFDGEGLPKLASTADVFDLVKKKGDEDGKEGGSTSDPQKPSSANTGDTELDLDGEDWEDWDAEMGIDETEGGHDLRSAFTAGAGLNNSFAEETITAKHRIMQEKTAVVIIKFASPTMLYSALDGEKEGGMRPFREEKEFSTWITQLVASPLADRDFESAESKNLFNLRKSNFHQEVYQLKKFSEEWKACYLRYCNEMARAGESEVVWETLLQFFAEVESSFGTKLGSDILKRLEVLCIHMLQIACKLWTVEEDASFVEMVESTLKLLPHQRDLVELMQAEAYAHHYESAEYMGLSPLDTFCELYGRQHDAPSLALRARILMDVHLLSEGLSPLTSAKLDIDPELITDQIEDKIHEGSNVEDLLAPQIRISTLIDLYPQLELGFLKAKAALAIGIYVADHERNHRLAERVFFEAVYILNKVPLAAEGLYPIVSELGTSCLLRFADKLLYNYKYKYGITAYHAASVAFQLRGKTKDYYNLLRQMATIAKENDDLKRAITYYRELLQMYLNSKKINEVIYVAEAVSKIYCDMGRFSVAEEYLLGAFGKLSKRQQVSSDAKAFQLLLALGKLYLKGPNPERGVLLLEYLNEGKLPRGKARSVFLALGKAYLTLRDFQSCDRLLRLSPVPATPEVPSHRHRRSTSSVGTSQLPRKASVKEITENEGNGADIDIEEMLAKNYFRAGKYGEAISCIDASIASCAKSNLNLLAKYFFIRGKFLQHVSAPWRQVKPSSITVNSDIGTTTFSSIGDLFQECIATFTTAYGYCSAVGDDVKAAKVLSRIAETYLDQVFLPVTLQHRNFESVSRFKYFVTSPVVRGDSSPPSGVEEFVISLKGIEEPAMLALDIGAGLSDPIILINIYLNIAELRFIMGSSDVSLTLWKEASWALVTLLVTPLLGQSAPASLLEKVYGLVQRTVRLLVCFDRTVVNEHLFLFDALSLLEIALDQAQKRQFDQDDASQQEDGSTMYHILRIHNMVSTRKPWLESISESEAAAGARDKAKRDTKRAQLTRKSTVRGLFGGTGGLDWSMLCNMGDSDVSEATLLLSELKCIKTQLNRFSNGKLAQDELFRRNQKYLQNMVKYSKEAHCSRIGSFKGFLHWADDSKNTAPRSTPFRQLVQSHAKLERTMYILNNHGYLLVYTPITGQFAAQQLFRPQAHSDKSDFDKKFHPRYAVRVTPMSDDQESGVFEVKSSVTLKELMYFICNTNQWAFGGQEDGYGGSHSATLKSSSSKKRVFNSLTRSSSTKYAVKFPVKPLEVSKGFVSEVNRLTSLVYPVDQGRNSQDLEEGSESMSGVQGFSGRLVFGIIATMSDASEHLVPLTALMDKPMSMCFPHSDNGIHSMQFFLYATSFTPSVVAMNENAEQLRQGITVPDSLVSFITKTLTGKIEEDSSAATAATTASPDGASSRGIDSDTVRTCFGWISSIVPKSNSKENARARRHSIYHKDAENPFADLKSGGYEPIPDTPLLVVCNRAAQAFPWELIFNDVTIRYYALAHALNRERSHVSGRGRDLSVVPAFQAFFYPTVDKHRRQQEDQRTRALAASVLTANKLLPHEFRKPMAFASVPSSTALRKMWRKKPKLFRTVQWISAEGALQSRPWDILRRVENLPMNDYSVFLLSYSDLVEVSEVVFYLISLAPTCTFVFIPRSSQRLVVQRLLKAELHYRKAFGKKQTLLDRYQYLMSILYNIQKSHQIPIAVVNGP